MVKPLMEALLDIGTNLGDLYLFRESPKRVLVYPKIQLHGNGGSFHFG
jgi:hypothetical protein